MKAENIELHPVRDTNGGFVRWEMSLNGGPKMGPDSYPTVNVAYKDTSHFTFTIADPGSITFSSDPIDIQKGTTKPAPGVDDQIKNVKVDNGTVLSFKDTNKDAGPLNYVLSFNNATQLDPIIQNGGGGEMLSFDWAALAIGVAVGAALAVAFVRLGLGWRSVR